MNFSTAAGIAAGILVLLFFPILLRTEGFFRAGRNKSVLSARLWGLIPVAGGYLTLKKGGIWFHYSEKKAKFFPFADKKSFGGFRITKALKTVRLEALTEIGAGKNAGAAIAAAGFLQAASNALFPVLHTLPPHGKFANDVFLYTEESGAAFSFRWDTVCNIAVVAVAYLKTVLEDLILLWQTKKKGNP